MFYLQPHCKSRLTLAVRVLALMRLYARESFVHYYHRPEFNRIREAWEGGFSSDAERDHFYESANEDVRSRREVSRRDRFVSEVRH